ncbi:GPI-anchored wall transfer protein [Trichodelitschia bisporula]|uniref:GPI-anchored wall transfer protein n=1 Tax=Trichodelitschia bisporula TaxID=703511 RepID=A0A6G1I0Z8_9PEZI|nr:GPI-anchored wall transfer protein [Trichodelitschia bisporula]
MERLKSNNYKALKEAFVSNLSGGPIWEIYAVTLVMPAAVLLWSVLQSRTHSFTPYTPVAFAVDVLLNCLVILFAITLYSGFPILLNALLIAPAILLLITPRSASRQKRPGKPPKHADGAEKSHMDPFPIKPFVTMYRGNMMVITCAAILAVDFKIFPRRFAKAETWGTSLMDMGVGSFVFTAGTVSARSVLKARFLQQQTSPLDRLRDSIRHATPLLVLGLIRLYTVKGVDYAEHVTEYGVHWNFFFTLGFLPPFVALAHSAIERIPSYIGYSGLALLIGVVYELMLDNTSLTAFILIAPRNNLFSQNREGIFSFFGYLAIFLAGLAAGMFVLPRESPQPTTSGSKGHFNKLRNSIGGKLLFWAAIWSALFGLTTWYRGFNLQVSRRLANLPYILWVAAFNCLQLALCYFAERLCFPEVHNTDSGDVERKRARNATSPLLHAFNRNGLAVFLLANLLTGAVNLTVRTLDASQLKAMSILVGYMVALSGVARLLDAFNISIKL